ncbi:tRNA pseudouridine(38-40) synthase TruA [Deinococcus sonorensis]|uniref:tRNA pseudouridine synthase A n=2 Tax=Deinococcus sonorensis TaxID=309891 RepID=A0AAU7UFA8_9DEIO
MSEPRLPYAPPPGFRRWQLEVQWDGAHFLGWQAQAEGRTVQDTLFAALGPLAASARPVAAGRTDAGVHAECMSLHWDMAETMTLPASQLQRALNARLPHDLAVLGCRPAPPDFHARYSCLERAYVYRLLNRPVRSPLLDGRALHVPQPLDVAAMQQAALSLLGEHDFAAFATREERQTRRRVHRLELHPAGDLLELHPAGDLLELHIAGESFLRHMVRGVVGTLLLVGRGALDPAAVAGILASGDRRQAGPNVPPHGLYFAGARYPVTDPAAAP